MNENHDKYIKYATTKTKSELAEILNVKEETIRKYQRITGVKYKHEHYINRTIDEWYNVFNEIFKGELTLSNLERTKTGHLKGSMKCAKCNHQWTGNVMHKIRNRTKCAKCDKGNRGNKYSEQEVYNMINQQYKNHWSIVAYHNYSRTNNIIKCNLCGIEHTINLSDFINTTSMRCTHCETGSFGEFVIATCLDYNNITFVREYDVTINEHKYRIDFMINDTIGLEYHGDQHYNEGLYYDEKINYGVEQKRKWCNDNGFDYLELTYSKTMNNIIQSLSDILNIELTTPPSDYLKHYSPDMTTTLSYLSKHSARQTMKDLNIPVTKLRRYVSLQGYHSISDWQNENNLY